MKQNQSVIDIKHQPKVDSCVRGSYCQCFHNDEKIQSVVFPESYIQSNSLEMSKYKISIADTGVGQQMSSTRGELYNVHIVTSHASNNLNEIITIDDF